MVCHGVEVANSVSHADLTARGGRPRNLCERFRFRTTAPTPQLFLMPISTYFSKLKIGQRARREKHSRTAPSSYGTAKVTQGTSAAKPEENEAFTLSCVIGEGNYGETWDATLKMYLYLASSNLEANRILQVV